MSMARSKTSEEDKSTVPGATVRGFGQSKLAEFGGECRKYGRDDAGLDEGWAVDRIAKWRAARAE